MIFKDGDNILTVSDAPDETEAFEYISDIWDWCKIWDVKKDKAGNHKGDQPCQYQQKQQ